MSYPPPPPGGYQPPPQHPYGYYAQQQWTPPPQIDPAALRPHRRWYWLSAIPAIVGIVIAVVLLIDVINRFDSGIENFQTPGTTTVELGDGDERGIYLQTAGTPGARAASSVTLYCSVRGPGGRTVPLKGASGFTITSGTDEYTEQNRFAAPADGRYTVSCPEPAGVPAAVGPHIALRLFWGPIVGMVVFSVGGIIASIVMAIVTASRRSSHKQRLQREAMQGR